MLYDIVNFLYETFTWSSIEIFFFQVWLCLRSIQSSWWLRSVFLISVFWFFSLMPFLISLIFFFTTNRLLSCNMAWSFCLVLEVSSSFRCIGYRFLLILQILTWLLSIEFSLITICVVVPSCILFFIITSSIIIFIFSWSINNLTCLLLLFSYLVINILDLVLALIGIKLCFYFVSHVFWIY